METLSQLELAKKLNYIHCWAKKTKFYKKPKVYLPCSIVFVAFLIKTGILQMILSGIFVVVVLLMSIISGISVVLLHGKHRVPPTPLPSREQFKVKKTLEAMTKNYNQHYYQQKTVISRQMDKSLQEVIDLVIRDFCLSWFRGIGKDETAFVEILNKEFWEIIENVVERLGNVDLVNFLANNVVNRLSTHFQDLRLSDARKFPGQTLPFLLHPALKDKTSELNFLRSVAESLLYCVLPPNDAHCAAVRYILREIVVNYIFLPTAESVCDPDYLNQTVVMYLEDREKITETHKQQYAYAETYEDFVKLINTTVDVETLKQIRLALLTKSLLISCFKFCVSIIICIQTLSDTTFKCKVHFPSDSSVLKGQVIYLAFQAKTQSLAEICLYIIKPLLFVLICWSYF